MKVYLSELTRRYLEYQDGNDAAANAADQGVLSSGWRWKLLTVLSAAKQALAEGGGVVEVNNGAGGEIFTSARPL
ncbi:MAG: hypothetical protein JWM36_2736 [Hyphomicrobiales bacterium]|nr:hypothetical protein [Hyphomicrobiales bacterium]